MSEDYEYNLFAPSKNKKKLIRNSKILTREYVPKRIIGRKLEMEKVADILRPCLDEEDGVPLNIIIYGKPGTGKTLVVLHVTNEFKKAIETNGHQPVPHVVYISCGKISGHVATIRSIIESIDPTSAMPGGYETSEYYNRLYALINKKKAGVILILDEIDRLPDNKLLYNLSRKHQVGDLSQDLYLGIIGLTNNLHYTDTWDASIRSSFGKEWISFKPYTAPEIQAILQDRIEAYHPNSLEEEVIPLISAISAQEHGDARLALELFHRAGSMAESKKKSAVSTEDVRAARVAIEEDQVMDCISTLPIQSRHILAAILIYYQNERGTPTSMNIYTLYRELTALHRVETLALRRYQDLINELHTLGLIEIQVLNQGRYGRTKKITPLIGGGEMMNKVLAQFAEFYGPLDISRSGLGKQMQL